MMEAVPLQTRKPLAVDFNQALARYEAGERETLLPALQAAVSAVSPDARLWHLHGLVLRELERHAESLSSLERAAYMAPASANIAHALARTSHEAGLPSVEAYAKAIRLSPGAPDLLLGLTGALLAERRIEDAIAGLERSLSLAPHWAAGHVELCRLRWMHGERDDFTRSFDEALAKMPANMELRRDQILVLMHAEKWDAALDAIARGRAAVDDETLFALSEAVIYSEMGEVQQADRLFERIPTTADATLQFRRVRHFLRSNRPQEAIATIDPWLAGPQAFLFWPYASIAWRMTDDPRSDWLEGDPRLVGVYDIADRLPPLTDLAEALRHLHTVRGEPLEQSVRGGTQTDGNLFHRIDPVIVRLREAIRATVEEHVAQLPAPDERHPVLAHDRHRPIRFNGAWSVRLTQGGYHANHVHPLGWVSSALYLVLPDDLGEEQAGFLTLGEPQAELNIALPPTRVVQPKPGRLVLFPGWMWHGTRPFGAGERMTVAFDVALPS